MRKLKVLIPVVFAGCAWLQPLTAQEDRTSSLASLSGKELFSVYCAACHGTDAKGKGPAAPAMKARVPDLTLLSQKHGGKFPLMQVQQEIQADTILAHGSREMPVYGDMFRDIKRDETFVKQRIGLLTGYIESLQQK